MTGEINHQLPQECLSIVTDFSIRFREWFNTNCSTELTKISV